MVPPVTATLENPLPMPSACHSFLGPPAGHCLSRPVSGDFPSRRAPRQPGQSAAGTSTSDGLGLRGLSRAALRANSCLTYRWSALLSLPTGTAVVLPSFFWRWAFPPENLTMAASTWYLPVESVHVRNSNSCDSPGGSS